MWVTISRRLLLGLFFQETTQSQQNMEVCTYSDTFVSSILWSARSPFAQIDFYLFDCIKNEYLKIISNHLNIWK